MDTALQDLRHALPLMGRTAALGEAGPLASRVAASVAQPRPSICHRSR
jgi:hypothetical protein